MARVARIVRGVVYIGTQLGFVDAYDAAGNTGCGDVPKTCSPIWESIHVGAIRSSPVVLNGKVYVGSTASDLYAFAAVGNTSCSFRCPITAAYITGGDVISSPAVANSTVYVGPDDHKLYAFDANGVQGCDVELQCQPLWGGPTGGIVRSSPP